MTDQNPSGKPNLPAEVLAVPEPASEQSAGAEPTPEVRAAAIPGAPRASAAEPLRAPLEGSSFVQRPSFIFFGVVSALSLLLDVGSKAWAEIELSKRGILDTFHVIENHLSFELAYNRGGAWSILRNAHEQIRRPFFVLVSLIAIVFIISIYGRLHRRQWALVWGLPLVFGGALGNFADRLVRGSVVDFILYRADWIMTMNRTIARFVNGWVVTDYWPVFNVADISICAGVCLMALDMLISKRGHSEPNAPPPPALRNVFGVSAGSKPPPSPTS